MRLPSLRRRARVIHLRVHPSDLARLASEPYFIATGISAAQKYGFDIAAPGVVESGSRAARNANRDQIVELRSLSNVAIWAAA